MQPKRKLFLGINAVYHESAAALVEDGKIIAAVEEERLIRVKHAKKATIEGTLTMPVNAIEWCLDKANTTFDEISGVGYSFSPKLRFEKNKSLDDGHHIPKGAWGTPEGERRLFELSRLTSRVLSRWFKSDLTGRFFFIPHHRCHLASAFFPSPYEEAAVLSIDGIGEWATTAIAHGKGPELELLEEIDYPHSIGFLWEKFTDFLGFCRNHDECKVMGLASYGDPSVYRDAFSSLINVDKDGFTVNVEKLRFRHEKDFQELIPLFGPPRLPGEPLEYQENGKRHANIASSLQEVTDKAILAIAKRTKELTKAKKLCIAGGVALNCVSNGVLAQEGIFEDIWIQPAAHDAGTAVGAAFDLYHRSNQERAANVSSVYLGPSFSSDDYEEAMKRFRLNEQRVNYEGSIASKVAKLVSEGNVVAWFQDALEWGPRALGNRSILADPRNGEMRNIINRRVKHREDFRPFCPSVLAEKAHEWFDFGESAIHAAEYMLVAYPTRKEKQSLIPAVVHIDGTARIQMVKKEVAPLYHEMISHFHSLTGVPIVLNTSFNDREPIVCTPDEAIRCFLVTAIDYLALGPYLIARKKTEQ